MDAADLQRPTYTATAVIAAAGSLSGAVNLNGAALVGVIMPAAWDTAGLTLQASADDGVTWTDVYDADGAEVSISAAIDRYIALPNDLIAIPQIKVRSGTGAVAVAQAAERTLTLVLAPAHPLSRV